MLCAIADRSQGVACSPTSRLSEGFPSPGVNGPPDRSALDDDNLLTWILSELENSGDLSGLT